MICFAVELSWLCVVLCIWTGMHMHMLKRRHIHIQIHVRSCACTHTCTYTYTHTYTCTQTYTHIHMHTFIHSYIHTFIHSYIHTFIRSYVHTHITIQNNYLTTLRYVILRYVTLHLHISMPCYKRTSRQPSDVGLPENPMVPQPLAHWAPPSWKRRWTSGS